MENAVESQESAFVIDDEIDFESFFELYPDGFILDDSEFTESPTETEAPLSFEDVEKFLMDDGGDDVTNWVESDASGDAFFSDVFLDGSGSGSDSGKSEVETPESGESVESEAEKEEEREEREEREGDDPVSKKQRRQVRNRESAMKSRERKKMYVTELEMKSKFLESECRRLNCALQCCMAENVALQLRLHTERPFGAPAAKQESAVLFTESLLLGSLFWLVSIVCLFLLPSLNPEVESNILGRDLVLEIGRSKAVNENFGYDLLIMRRRCKSTRTRMKSFLFRLHA